VPDGAFSSCEWWCCLRVAAVPAEAGNPFRWNLHVSDASSCYLPWGLTLAEFKGRLRYLLSQLSYLRHFQPQGGTRTRNLFIKSEVTVDCRTSQGTKMWWCFDALFWRREQTTLPAPG